MPGDVTPYLMPWNILSFANKILCKSSPKFQYKNRGAMASMGFGGGVTDLKQTSLPSPKTTMTGAASYLVWSSTYLTKQLSIQNMILIPVRCHMNIVLMHRCSTSSHVNSSPSCRCIGSRHCFLGGTSADFDKASAGIRVKAILFHHSLQLIGCVSNIVGTYEV